MLTKSFKQPIEAKNEPMEVKSADYSEVSLIGINALNILGLKSLTAQVAWNYYKKVDPLFNAVDYIATEGSEIKLTIYDTEEKIHIDEIDPTIPATGLLKLMAKPSPDKTGKSLMYSLLTSQLVTGDVFVVATGLNPKEPPKELHYHGKQYLDISSASDGLPYSYSINKPFYNEQFKRDGLNYNFYNVTKTQEIRQIAQQFNPEDGDTCLFGMSRLSPLYYQMEQHIQGNIHNTKLLENGARPSGALIMKGISTDAKNQIKEQVKNFYTGSENAGNVMALSVAGSNYEDVEFKELSINNKDMDFVELKKMAEMAVYKIFKIPASFYDNTKSTFNNVSSDTYKIYDLAIIPTLKDIVDGLNEFLMPRYDDSGRYRLSFSLRDIPALEMRYIDIATSKIDTGLMTVPEGRNSLNLSEWDEKDPLYNPKHGVKEEVDDEGKPQKEEEAPEEENEEAEAEKDKKHAYDTFHGICKAEGMPEAEIKQMAIKQGLL